MTTAALPTPKASDLRLIAGISAAHFVSHYYILILPPLFGFVRADYGVSYTQLGLALTAFNVASTVLQVPAGLLVDRVSAKLVLIVGLLLGAGAFAAAGLVDSFWVLVAMFAIAGIGNTAYHPADYALLSHHVSPQRLAQAFSFHTFAGILGGAVAPMSLLAMASLWGWRGAFVGAGALGFVVAIALMLVREPAEPAHGARKAADAAAPVSTWQLLMSGPILGSFVFFVLLACGNFGIQNYFVVALGALYGTDATTANTALTGNLLLGALGVLIGGIIASRTARHGLVATVTLVVTGATAVLIGTADFGAVVLVLLMSIGGLANGISMPSRDMIVRAVTPPGLFGTVFGFVSTGFNLAGVVAPLIFGPLLDHGAPRGVFLVVGGVAALAIVVVALTAKLSVRPN
jgi:MFS family permease